ncbi:MAG: hypothetical protein DMG14_09605 [Acidobacteria bacterium]|nr:MAG: hypothetical protein DMG14_09605 [Acidobacteriota bacterium]
MRLFRSARILICSLTVLIPAAPRTLREEVKNSAADLAQQIQARKIVLNYDETHGYLRSLLKQLNVPISSQTLVFSKSSFQLSQIGPEAPRAVYFNDDVYVGWVNHGQFIEIAEVDPQTGPVFYKLTQEYDPYPLVQRETEECLVCHDTFQTSTPVPRLLMLSVLPNPEGNALKAAALITNDQSPLRERWGGWYVTGTHGMQRHLGNTLVRARADDVDDMKKFIARMDLSVGANVTDLRSKFDTKEYLSPHSDIVALMVLGHQTHVHNMITSGVYEIRDAITQGLSREKMADAVKDAGERIVRAMLFVSEAQLTEPIRGTSSFAEEFMKRGPRDSKGRSLRDLDLQHRLLRYPLSYLIYSKSFDAMPGELKDYVNRRVREVLTGEDKSADFQHLSAEDRTAILEILRETKPGF